MNQLSGRPRIHSRFQRLPLIVQYWKNTHSLSIRANSLFHPKLVNKHLKIAGLASRPPFKFKQVPRTSRNSVKQQICKVSHTKGIRVLLLMCAFEHLVPNKQRILRIVASGARNNCLRSQFTAIRYSNLVIKEPSNTWDDYNELSKGFPGYVNKLSSKL